MAIVPNYKTPVSGTIAPAANAAPTQYFESSTRYNKVVAELNGDGSATGVTITHNLGMSPAELAADLPDVGIENVVSGAPTWWVTARTTNNVQLSFGGTFSGTFGVCKISRPLSNAR